MMRRSLFSQMFAAVRRRRRLVAFVAALAVVFLALAVWRCANQTVLRISDWRTGEIYIQVPAKPGDTLFFGWIHSWEKIPWNEYYHIAPDRTLVLDTITFPAFGAGIPEDKGVTHVRDGLIYMEEIGQVFEEFIWLNSHTATRDILLNDQFVTRGSLLPQHTVLRLSITRRGVRLWKKTS